MRSLRDILHLLLCNLPFRRNYAGKISWTKKFSQRALRRKDIKEFEVYQKTDYSVFRKKRFLNSLRTKKTLRLCVLCVRFITATALELAYCWNKYLGSKKISQRALRRKVCKNIKSIKRLIILFPEKRDTLKLFAH